jgi:hypothetical protein
MSFQFGVPNLGAYEHASAQSNQPRTKNCADTESVEPRRVARKPGPTSELSAGAMRRKGNLKATRNTKSELLNSRMVRKAPASHAHEGERFFISINLVDGS